MNRTLQASTVNETLKEYGRGIVGGLIFSLPLLYTMEVWWAGFIATPVFLLGGIVITFLLLLGYNRFAGMREDATFYDLCWDSAEEFGLAFIVSFVFLLLIGQISFTMSIDEILGKVIIESMFVAIGISVGTAQLGQNGDEATGMSGEKYSDTTNFFSLLILSVCGAVLFAATVAPTEEIVIIAIKSHPIHLLALVIMSLFLCSIILYFSEFKGTGPHKMTKLEIGVTVAISYTIALLVALALLLFFGRIENNGLGIILAQAIVLGVPASIGASAGRLLISQQ
ncbi:MAG: TIGR02587 family membrane protein [Flavobacterium sp.]|nr:TIGR02587 family membrane protein [Flavobacterium sp.]